VGDAAGARRDATALTLERLNPKFSRALLLVGRLQAVPYVIIFLSWHFQQFVPESLKPLE